MKFLFRLLIVQLACSSLLITDAMARGFGGGGGGRAGGGRTAQPTRSFSKPASKPNRSFNKPANRSPITNSKFKKPAYQKPTTRPSARPTTRPSTKPTTRPTPKPTTRPTPKPTTRPTAKPTTRPTTKPAPRPSTRPSTGRPTLPSNRPSTRPSTRPGNVTYPKPDKPMTLPNRNPGGAANRPGAGGGRPSTRPGETRPGTGNRPGVGGNRPGSGNRPGLGDNRPGSNRPGGNRPVQRPGQNTRPIQRPDFNRPGNNRPGSGNNNRWWSGGRNNIGNKVNININNNFQKNLNWSTNRRHWGYNPWWNRPATRPWYGGSWNCGWNRRYHHHYHRYYYGGYRPLPGYVIYDDRNDFAEAIGWGLAAWGLGKLIFDSGYNSYQNPYPAQPVAGVTYNQPITVVATEATGDADDLERATSTSEAFIARSQDAFKVRDYLVALELADKAIEAAPGDGALHEYRALALFALGKYGEAAGVLNPILASGPGWDWTTMVTLYDAQQTYTDQLRRLEDYATAKADDAAAQFLLGYHYMVCGHLDMAALQFEKAAELQPADSVSRQLADLCKASTNSADDGADEAPEDPPEDEAAPGPARVPVEKLTGTWVADKGKDGTITLTLKSDGNFVWDYTKDGTSSDFGGVFSMNDSGLLVLDTDDTQMVAMLEMPADDELKFVLAGGPPGDPGLDFKKD